MRIANSYCHGKITSAIHLCAILALFLPSCNQQYKVEDHSAKSAVVADTDTIAVDTTQLLPLIPPSADTSVRSFARLLAGLDTLRGMEWYAKTIRASIERHEARQMVNVRRWSAQELRAQSQADVIFYPFSGPDALYMLGLFPHAKQYVMIASEPAGSFPRFNRLGRDSIKTYLESVIESTREVYSYSYFITDSMRKNIADSIVNGTLPIITLFMAQHGYDILGYDRVADVSSDSTKQQQLRHVLYFRRDSASPVQQLTYIEANLGNARYMGLTPFPQNNVLREYLNTLPRCHSFVKSASYLMHNAGFSAIRSFVLSKSQSILQDDTGVPYGMYGSGWSFRFYGEYTRPIRMFAGRYQADLDSAFLTQAGRHTALPFYYGYLFSRGKQNVFLASRTR
ncbi:MAG: hypothetical protein FJ211_09425 [Ignavibacteria bacterium]|nr:hypothetical protein [Ignavibacteria bacterium]